MIFPKTTRRKHKQNLTSGKNNSNRLVFALPPFLVSRGTHLNQHKITWNTNKTNVLQKAGTQVNCHLMEEHKIDKQTKINQCLGRIIFWVSIGMHVQYIYVSISFCSLFLSQTTYFTLQKKSHLHVTKYNCYRVEEHLIVMPVTIHRCHRQTNKDLLFVEMK